MTPTLSGNTQAILLLTAPLIVGRGTSSSDLLSPGEYKRLARHLREVQRQPADLVSSNADEALRECRAVIDMDRLQRLLGRGFLLSQAIERWQARAIWLVSRADPAYPRRLKARLRENAPAMLYGCGDASILETGGLAVVGSRNVDDSLVEYTMSVGQLTARAGRTLVSGGAKGIDQAAMRGALEAGGKVCGVLADGLERASMSREHRGVLLDRQLVLISPYDPGAGFNVGNAMQRNKLIYALADASLVVNSDINSGGTWAGAVEQLDKFRFVPVYVRSTGERSIGLEALERRGALRWPNPQDIDSFAAVFEARTASSQMGLSLPPEKPASVVASSTLPTPVVAPECQSTVGHSEESPPVVRDGVGEVACPNTSDPAERLFEAVSKTIQQLLRTPLKDADVAEALNVTTAQAKIWLQRLVEEGVLEKQKKPVGYVVKQKRLFD